MRTFEVKSLYDSTNKKWLEFYFIDGREVEPDEYFANLESEEIEKVKDYEEEQCECGGDCENCDMNDEVAVVETEFCTCESCTEEREQAVIEEFLDMLFDPDGACKRCVIEKFINTIYMFKDFGAREAKEQMKEFLDN